ncbi:MAG TPA: hypothetical protein DCZ20_01920 [Lachnospiraceae bacterium]|nr:hypothetical protein [Lachnospiraceae bacterium]
MLKHKGKYQTYTDGWGTVWKVKDRRLVGIRQAVLHFQEQTVGERRYWDAYVAGTQVTKAVRVPYEASVEQGDIFMIGGNQYEVVQKDLKDDRLPASWLLSLASVVIEYREGEKGGGQSESRS